MLKNAYLYEKDIKEALYAIWYDPKYQYYFMGPWHGEFGLDHEHGDWDCRSFAVLNHDNKLIGYMGYHIDHETNMATNFGAINFSDDIATFGAALKQCIDDIFIKFGMNRLEFSVVVGNPAEKGYDKLINRYGGRILCTRRQVAKDMAGNLKDDKSYELMREEYLAAKEKRHGK